MLHILTKGLVEKQEMLTLVYGESQETSLAKFVGLCISYRCSLFTVEDYDLLYKDPHSREYHLKNKGMGMQWQHFEPHQRN